MAGAGAQTTEHPSEPVGRTAPVRATAEDTAPARAYEPPTLLVRPRRPRDDHRWHHRAHLRALPPHPQLRRRPHMGAGRNDAVAHGLPPLLRRRRLRLSQRDADGMGPQRHPLLGHQRAAPQPHRSRRQHPGRPLGQLRRHVVVDGDRRRPPGHRRPGLHLPAGHRPRRRLPHPPPKTSSTWGGRRSRPPARGWSRSPSPPMVAARSRAPKTPYDEETSRRLGGNPGLEGLPPQMQVADDGTLYILFPGRSADNTIPHKLLLATSKDQGATFTAHRDRQGGGGQHDADVPLGPRGRAQRHPPRRLRGPPGPPPRPRDIFYTRSTDGGATFTSPKLMNDDDPQKRCSPTSIRT